MRCIRRWARGAAAPWCFSAARREDHVLLESWLCSPSLQEHPQQLHMGINVGCGSGPCGMLQSVFEEFGASVSTRLSHSQLHSQYSRAWHMGFVARSQSLRELRAEDKTERGIYAVILSLLPLLIYQWLYLYSCLYVHQDLIALLNTGSRKFSNPSQGPGYLLDSRIFPNLYNSMIPRGLISNVQI